MRRIRLDRSGLTVSRLGFGTSRLHYLSRRDAEALVGSAVEAGVTHFDTARLYGDGFGEAVLGTALRPHRSGVTIGTKFGILPSRLIEAAGPFATPLRGVRSVLRRAGVAKPAKRSWTVETLDRSLATSLRRLRTDYVDILFLHEPGAGEVDRSDDLVAALVRHKEAGRIRATGVSTGTAGARWLVDRYGAAIDVIQIPEDDWAENDLVPDISFGALTSGPQVYGAARPSRDRVRGGVERALARRPGGCLLVGTTKPAHLREMVAFAAAADP